MGAVLGVRGESGGGGGGGVGFALTFPETALSTSCPMTPPIAAHIGDTHALEPTASCLTMVSCSSESPGSMRFAAAATASAAAVSPGAMAEEVAATCSASAVKPVCSTPGRSNLAKSVIMSSPGSADAAAKSLNDTFVGFFTCVM